ncbi:MAG: hypothetical protein A2X97_12595 [Bdellovibrionales bacterium GWA1_52_35]|nr:MAG: hypothetical protein A2X97_12595 [Bdellovibrionales bacterium GWA1_52_35]
MDASESKSSTRSVAVIGTGPAGLMAADVIARAGHSVTIYEKSRGPGRKLLIAGSSGLNISHDDTPDEFWRNYRGPAEHFRKLFLLFPPRAWLDFIHSLGIKTFRGTSRRYFVEGLKASPLLRAWIMGLQEKRVQFKYSRELVDFDCMPHGSIQLRLRNADAENETETFDAVCLALGGGSYAGKEKPLRWPAILKSKGIQFQDFRASNVGFEVDWSPSFLQEAEGLPLKTIVLKTSLGEKSGDLMITHYGIEGTPVYHVGQLGEVYVDLKPGLSLAEIQKKLRSIKENLAPIRKIKKQLSLCPAALALLFHGTPRELLQDSEALIRRVKRFPLVLKHTRPLEEAISSAGGLEFRELTPELMLLKFPGIFTAGEMLDWDAPTGGFLIQGCASEGFLAGKSIVEYLKK